MAKANVQIDLERPAGPYQPGDVVQATITLQNDKEFEVRGGAAWLVLWEEYEMQHYHDKKVRKEKKTAELQFSLVELVGAGRIPAGTHTYPVSLQLPEDAAAPYAGDITKNGWRVQCKFDSPNWLDPAAKVELALVVLPPGLQVGPGEYGTVEQSEEAELRLVLPKLECVEGETVTGKLRVQPGKNFKVNEVRVELVRTEVVPGGYNNSHSETEGKVKLAADVEFWPSQTAEYAFSLPVPKKGLPTRSTQHSQTNWILKGTLARRLRKDSEISTVIEVYTAR